MPAIPVNDFMKDAPSFRIHEGINGARYHIKDPNDRWASGMWFVETPERMEIATRKKFDGAKRIMIDDMEPKTLEAARSQYDFRMVDVQTGDVIIRYYAEYKGARTLSHEEISSNFSKFYNDLHNSGCDIYFHIPAAEFHANYELNAPRQEYREKPFRKKLAQDHMFIQLSDGSVEELPAYADLTLAANGSVSINRDGMFPGMHTREIAGESLQFYITKAKQAAGLKPGLFDLLPASSGLTYHVKVRNGIHDRKPNPYAVHKAMFDYAVGVFKELGNPMWDNEKAEFIKHHDDITMRHALFEGGLTLNKGDQGISLRL